MRNKGQIPVGVRIASLAVVFLFFVGKVEFVIEDDELTVEATLVGSTTVPLAEAVTVECEGFRYRC